MCRQICYAQRGIIDCVNMLTTSTQENIQQNRWYALKVFYNRVYSVEQFLLQDDIRYYIPTVEREVKLGNRTVKRREPAISSLMFAYASEQYLQDLQKRLKNTTPFMLYYDREAKRPAPISDHEMNIFMLVTSAGEQSLEYIGEDMVNFEQGTHVRVTGGPFEGAEGYIHRVKGDRRLIVRIEGVVAVATAYIPNSFLQRIEDL